MSTLDEIAALWVHAKEGERQATEERRNLEDKLLSLVGLPDNLEGTENIETDGGYKIKAVGRFNRKVDADKIQEIAAEEGLEDYLGSLFRWKPEMNMAAWKAASKNVTTPLLAGITTAPGRISISITKKDK